MKKMPTAMFAAFLALTALPSLPAYAAETGAAPSMTCDAGPTKKEFGKAQWLLYGCDDRKSAIIVSGDDTAGPFYFKISLKGSQYQVVGEGTGNRDVTAAALKELKAMPASQLRDLVDQANKSR